MPLQIDINASGVSGFDAAKLEPAINKAVKTTVSIAGLQFPRNAELSILISDDKTLQSLNHKWRGKNTPTNVLSFAGDPGQTGKAAGPMLGDIVISLETAGREAALANQNPDHHVIHLIVHGFLHLFGYDHKDDKKAGQMEGLERKVLAELGIKDPYASGVAE